MGFVLRRAAYSIAGVGRESVAQVMDAHLETVSMIFVTTMWAVGYGWVEGTVGIGHLLAINPGIQWFGRFSTYHFVLGLTIFAISFSFGFLKFTRMLYHRKRYMFFTALGNYPYGLVAQDFAYFFFAPGDLQGEAWTCQGLGLGCWAFHNPWNMTVPFVVPRWYVVALTISIGFFFLAYRSALVNLLVTRAVLKDVGFQEKTLIKQETCSELRTEEASALDNMQNARELSAPPMSKPEKDISKIVSSEREELMERLRNRLNRGI